MLALAHPVGLAAVAVAVVAHGEPPPGWDVLLAVPAALLGTVGIAAFYRGMATGSISVVAPIAALGAVIPVVAGLAVGERPSSVQTAGFALAIGGAAAASYEPAPIGARAGLASGVAWAFVAAVGFGGYFVPMHEASDEDFLWAAFVFRLCSTSFVVAAALVMRPTLPRDRRDLAAIVVIGIADTGGNVCFAAASTLGLVSVVSVLASLYPVVTVALARIYLRERVGRLQEAGIVATLAGVVAVSAG